MPMRSGWKTQAGRLDTFSEVVKSQLHSRKAPAAKCQRLLPPGCTWLVLWLLERSAQALDLREALAKLEAAFRLNLTPTRQEVALPSI